ncbi:hypothetical protein [Amycolatopsis albispora]|uniref:ATP-grasp domain-containing protein n=1 Tax=Amycolatopsis albispora TaxID=1804986 RepID=A0A344LH69_9PSEU|nr:hypothetical protein [Amycolatopsis albispora]AXB47393.1 hypothetical protein A4R43_37165 [Amycolatopsis albispora]
MTIVIMDGFPGPLPPYAEWLRDSGKELLLVTGRAREEVGGGYDRVEVVEGYANSPAVDRFLLNLGLRTELSAIVATETPDLVRSGALRDYFGIAGQSREDAAVLADPVAVRERLAVAGVPVIDVAPVLRITDVYAAAAKFGYPVRIRERKIPGHPAAAVLNDEAEVRIYTQGGLTPDLISVPSLFAEPWVVGERHRVVGPVPAASGERPELVSIVEATLAALPVVPGQPYAVEVVHTTDGRWLVDGIGAETSDEDEHRTAVRVQAGLETGVKR